LRCNPGSRCHSGRAGCRPVAGSSVEPEVLDLSNEPRLCRSDVEAEVDDVAVLDDVVLALDPELSGLAAARLASELDQVAPVDHLGADEASLDVGVDLPGR